MRIDETSLAFGYTANGAGNPNWSIALGQSQPSYKINFKQNPGLVDILIGMTYCAVPVKKVSTRMGKGAPLVLGITEGTPIISAALFSKVYVNNIEIPDGKFILLIDKDTSESHKGRLRLRYSKHNTYKDDTNTYSNDDFYKKVREQFGLAENACWFVYDISVEDQDTLKLKLIVVNESGPMTYPDSKALHAAWKLLVDAELPISVPDTDMSIIPEDVPSNCSLEELAKILSKMYSSPKGSGKVAAIHMFAIKYAEQILENGYKNKDLAIAAGINESYDVEINKGLNIYKSIKENEYNIHFYSENNSDLSEAEKEVFDFNSLSGSAINKIFFGVPGCGKSYHIEHNILGKDKNSKKYVGKYKKENIIRTTFYQDYSNTDFVGQILPKITKDENGEDNVEYIFNPGPFTLALIQAIKAKNANTETFMPTNNKVALVIEEVNRGNAPAIFGDIFQLLDRDEDGISEYGIVNVGVIDYLNSYNFGTEENPVHYKFDEIKIPGNMDIFATMNTSDQNVYTLDTAFTRRWEKERIANKFDANSEIAKYYVPGITGCTWEEFVNKINHKIQTSLDDLQVNEDKQLGCFFIRKRDLIEKYTEAKAVSEESKRAFAYKVLQYLWDDVTKLEHSVIFSHNYKTFDELVDAYIAGGAVIFNDTISFDIETPKENNNGQ